MLLSHSQPEAHKAEKGRKGGLPTGQRDDQQAEGDRRTKKKKKIEADGSYLAERKRKKNQRGNNLHLIEGRSPLADHTNQTAKGEEKVTLPHRPTPRREVSRKTD